MEPHIERHMERQIEHRMEHQMNDRPADLIRASDARKLLDISPFKMAQLLREGVVRQYSDPLDKRVKLVSRAEVLALRAPRAEAA